MRRVNRIGTGRLERPATFGIAAASMKTRERIDVSKNGRSYHLSH
jgi:hypothetical protein